MKELHSIIDQDGFGHILDKNNQYYQPTIKTSREEKYPKRMFFENNEYIPKQPLIKFLEDKIKEYESLIFENSITASDNELLFYKQKLTAFQEILDFVNKGGKE